MGDCKGPCDQRLIATMSSSIENPTFSTGQQPNELKRRDNEKDVPKDLHKKNLRVDSTVTIESTRHKVENLDKKCLTLSKKNQKSPFKHFCLGRLFVGNYS
jgi:hypothetical protein